ncbi:MAG: hypothetical protein M3Y85_03695 [Bacteroidota bacterium]|nr:hypothetical protein [Bacteroidota bacterium]
MKKNLLPSRAFGLLLCAGFFLTTVSCSHKVGFTQSSVVPAAQGSIKMKKDNNNNYKIEVSVTNLAPPDRLQPPHSVYVVWIETEQNGTKNIGQLNSESGFLSKALKGSLTAISPYKPTRLFITAEDNAAIQFPNSMVVLSTDRFN